MAGYYCLPGQSTPQGRDSLPGQSTPPGRAGFPGRTTPEARGGWMFGRSVCFPPAPITTLVVFLVVGSFLQVGASSRCGPNEVDMDGTRCCRKCPPGTGVSSPCTTGNDTICTPCITGDSFSGISSHTTPCQPCSLCQARKNPVQACNVTMDTICECDWNYFWSETHRKCTLCDLCPVGHGAWQSCGSNHNTRCRRCPVGTFSDRRSLAACRPCRVCSANQIRLQQCNFRENTVCVDVPKVRTTMTSLAQTEPSTDVRDGGGGSDVIPVYCALLGAVVAGLVIYVIVTQIRRGRARAVKSVAAPVPVCPQHVRESCVGQSNVHLATPGSDSGVAMDAEGKPGLLNMHVRDLPIDRKRALESLLHAAPDNEGGWRALARQLGYNTSQIASVEARANQDVITPSRYLVAELGKANTATVGSLQVALRQIGRDDLATVLQTDRAFVPQHYHVPPSVRGSREALQERTTRRHSYRDPSRASHRDSRELQLRQNVGMNTTETRSVCENNDVLRPDSVQAGTLGRLQSYDV